MPTTLTAQFKTRREAEMAIERLVQEFGIERTDIFITTDGADNSAGEIEAGSDTEAGLPSPEGRDDAALKGKIIVSVDCGNDGVTSDVQAAFAEFRGQGLSES